MSIAEKILLVQLLLYDIRCNWGWENDNGNCSRAIKARDLCEELARELNDDRFMTLASCCNEYTASYCIDGDGRYFRNVFPYGYEDMETLHNLAATFLDKSDEFKELAETYITFPDTKFDDWEDRYAD